MFLKRSGRAVLSHANGDITTHESAVEILELLNAVRKIESGPALRAAPVFRTRA